MLKQFLPSVVDHSRGEGVAVYVADNGSTDNSLELISTEFPTVYQIRLDRNYGFAEGYNLALQQITADYYVLLNSDVEVTHGWLNPLVEFMDANHGAAACAPKLLDHKHRGSFEYAGAAGGFIDPLGYPFCRGRILSHIEEDRGQYNTPVEVFWTSGACMFVRSSMYKKVGELDGRFFAHMEEIDLCWRFHNAGYSVWNIPQSEVYHVGGGTLPNNNPHKLYLNYRNSLYMLFKNLNRYEVIPVMTCRMALDVLSALVYLMQLKLTYFAAVVEAYISFLKSVAWLRTWRQRSSKLKKRHIATIYPRFIVFDFFINKRHEFSKLPYFNTALL